jgi:hypothetical protein
MLYGRHSIQTGIPINYTREEHLLQLGKELSGLSEEAVQKTVEHTRETASEPPRKMA